MALKRVSIPSPNYSSRGGATVTTIVLHTAEGATDYQSLGSFFANPASGVSSHVGIDDTPNTVGEYVPRSGKAWTAANANPWAVQAELCAFADWDSATWNSHPQMLANTAAWIAEEAAYFDIPLVWLTEAQAQNPDTRGVCQHADLGSMGGGHWDCGPGFPMDQVLAMAGGQTNQTIGDDDLPLNDDDKNWITDAINTALRQQFAPEGECFGRVVQADQKAIQQTPANIPK
jgi:N-acetylmuramoyl-L-alanine amidase